MRGRVRPHCAPRHPVPPAPIAPCTRHFAPHVAPRTRHFALLFRPPPFCDRTPDTAVGSTVVTRRPHRGLSMKAISLAGFVGVCLIVASSGASAQESKSAPLAKQLVAAMEAAKLDSIAAKDP